MALSIKKGTKKIQQQAKKACDKKKKGKTWKRRETFKKGSIDAAGLLAAAFRRRSSDSETETLKSASKQDTIAKR